MSEYILLRLLTDWGVTRIFGYAKSFTPAILGRDPQAGSMVIQSAKEKLEEFLPAAAER